MIHQLRHFLKVILLPSQYNYPNCAWNKEEKRINNTRSSNAKHYDNKYIMVETRSVSTCLKPINYTPAGYWQSTDVSSCLSKQVQLVLGYTQCPLNCPYLILSLYNVFTYDSIRLTILLKITILIRHGCMGYQYSMYNMSIIYIKFSGIWLRKLLKSQL